MIAICLLLLVLHFIVFMAPGSNLLRDILFVIVPDMLPEVVFASECVFSFPGALFVLARIFDASGSFVDTGYVAITVSFPGKRRRTSGVTANMFLLVVVPIRVLVRIVFKRAEDQSWVEDTKSIGFKIP